MDEIVGYKQFVDDGRSERDTENFQQFLFKDIDFRGREKAISFYRSDFREVKFENVKFFRNEFDRADFVDSYITNSSFIQSHFGSDFINVYFNDTEFEENNFENCTFLRCIFRECMFTRGKISGSTLQNSVFINCNFKETEFPENTFEEIEFDKCQFSSINLANMTAKDFMFRDCTYTGLTVDPDYIGSYLINGDFFEDVTFEYRGSIIEGFDDKTKILEGLINLYKKSNRYYELFNLLILHRKFAGNQSNILDYLENIISKLSMVKHPPIRSYNLLGIIKTLTFYLDSSLITAKEYLSLIASLENTINPYKEFSEFGLFQAFKNRFESELFESPSRAENIIAQAVFSLKEEVNIETKFEKWLDSIEEIVVTDLRVATSGKLYEKVSVQKGSIIFTIAASLTFVLFLVRRLATLRSEIDRRRSYNNFVNIYYKELTIALGKTKTVAEKIELAKAYNILSKGEIDVIDKKIVDISKMLGNPEDNVNNLDIFI